MEVKAENVSYSGPLWHVAQVDTGHEISVAEDIHEELGYAVFVPAERIWTVRRGRRVHAARPLFSGYVFPCVHPYRQDWQRILDVDGVIDVLGRPMHDSGRPSHVPTAWIELMRHMQDVGEFDRTKIAPDGFDIDELVRVSEGPFAGHNGIIKEFMAKMKSATARKRARLLVQFMGRMSAIEMDVTALEKL